MNGYRILIVDDDQSTHDVVGTYLQLAGFQVGGCHDGAEVERAAGELCPDLVLLDIQMPIVHGFDALSLLRKSEATQKTPVIFLSSLRRADLKIKGLELGAEDYITKPCSKPELLARIRAALRRSERYQRHSSTLEGDLADLGLATLLQTLELGRKSCVVSIPAHDAELSLQHGTLSFVRFGRFDGSQALTRAVFLESGAFNVAFDAPQSVDGGEQQDSPEQRTMVGALMRAHATLDEVGQLGAELLEGNPLLEISGQDACLPLVAEFEQLSPISAHTLLVQMSGTLQENIRELREASARGIITRLENDKAGWKEQ